ncbi:MAG: hypothetical protein Q4D89_02985 [Arachnia propionica]|uniref:hypothetical protein n=1 Tax=Arachnia propionica TaxID=1750 RepID=UPI00270C3DA9|nr:hypothetical protein [Arachnia propionica]
MLRTAWDGTEDCPRFEIHSPILEKELIRLPYVGVLPDGRPIRFEEQITLPAAPEKAPAKVVEALLRLLSLAASLSYYKAFTPCVVVVPDGLTAPEHDFLTAVISGGLGEFAYTNDLPEALHPEILSPRLQDRWQRGVAADHPVSRTLVPVGGGKDSIVTIEALRDSGVDVHLIAVNPKRPQHDTARVAGRPLHEVTRRIDPRLLELNAEGVPNGHVPVTAINSLISLLTAVATGCDAVVFSNEASASFGNVEWQGQVVNHQWSKGIGFETLLRDVLPAEGPTYFSLLRPLTELRVARRFAEHRSYHPIFTSCNRAYRMAAGDGATWCGDCPKCRFVFLILAPFLPREELLDIWGGKDLLADGSQQDGFVDLLGAEGTLKPFECVGEPDECRVALTLLREHPDWAGHPALTAPGLAGVAASQVELERVFAWQSDEHCLPERFEEVVRAV